MKLWIKVSCSFYFFSSYRMLYSADIIYHEDF